MEEKNYRFFAHKTCEYFPCHKTPDPESFNCLFCYCPLYVLGSNCGGNYRYLQNGRKDCSECMIPHRKECYDFIVGKYSEIEKMMRKTDHSDI